MLLQLAAIPDEGERANLAAAGIQLLAYIPDNAWLATVPASRIGVQTLETTSIRWMGPLLPHDKISTHIQANGIGAWVIRPGGWIVLGVSFFADIPASEALAIIARHEGQVEQDLREFHHYAVRFPHSDVANALAAEDKMMWLDNGPPPKMPLNDGAREQTNVDLIQQTIGLDGSGVVLGIWDEGQVDPSHPDSTGRLTIAEDSFTQNHATHVAGTMAGDGRNSANQGGAAYQWRGVANGSIIANTGYVSAAELSTSHSSTFNTTVLAPALSLTKSASPVTALAGQVLTTPLW